MVLFDFSLAMGLIGSTILTSTDPIRLREIVRDKRIPQSVR
jgi:NhaP-type Na+/H+ or K+/H+ antiporter